MSDNKTLSQIWTDIPLQKNQITSHKIGPLTIHTKKLLNEIWIAYSYDAPQKKQSATHLSKRTDANSDDVEEFSHEAPLASKSDSPDDFKWNRWAMKDDISAVSIRPIFPDRSVVIKPEYPFKLASGASVRVYTRIPVFARISPAGTDQIITEIPTVKITGTWFGNFLDGELCYMITSKARREITEDLYENHLCFTPMAITNNSNEDLPFDKMSLKVDQLSIYMNEKALWADLTKVTHLGGDKHSDIEMHGKAPDEAVNAKLIAKPRTPVRKSMAVRTFRLLKDIPTFGIINI